MIIRTGLCTINLKLIDIIYFFYYNYYELTRAVIIFYSDSEVSAVSVLGVTAWSTFVGASAAASGSATFLGVADFLEAFGLVGAFVEAFGLAVASAFDGV